MKLKILYRDRDLIVVHKPAGTVVYHDGSPGDSVSIQDLLREQIANRVFPVHRLDKGTCGILVFALNSEVAAVFQKAFFSREVKKTYWALVAGEAPRNGKITVPLSGNKDKIKKPAVSQFHRSKLGRVGEETLSLLEVWPETGRYHQIRRHLKHIGHSIIGDTQYGGKKLADRPLLSAVQLDFIQPRTGKKVRIQTQPDPDFLKMSRALRPVSESNSNSGPP